MSRIISTLLIFIILTGVIITGYSFTSRCYDEFSELYMQAEREIEEPEQQNAVKTVRKMIQLIEKNKSKLMMMNDHDTIEPLLCKLRRAEKLLKLNEKAPASAELGDAGDIMKAIYEYQKPDIENIL